MPANLDRRFRPRLTLRQLGILVAMSAIGSAVMMPQARRMDDVKTFLFTSGIEVPYVLILPVVFLVRQGPLKNWMLSALCVVPIVAFLGLVAYRFLPGGAGMVPGIVPGIVLVMAALPMMLGLGFVSRWLLPRACPDCRQLAMLRDVTVPKSRLFPLGSEPRTCLSCGARFRRSRGGPWVDVDLLDPSDLPASIKLA